MTTRRSRGSAPAPALIGILGLACAASLASAQQDGPPCEDDRFAGIEFMVGSWTVEASEPDDPVEARRGSSTVSMIAGGCALQEHLRFDDGYEEVRLVAFDERAGQWQLSLVDSDHGNVLLLPGNRTADGLEFISVHQRATTLLVDRVTITDSETGWTYRIEAASGYGEDWRPLRELRYTRQDLEPTLRPSTIVPSARRPVPLALLGGTLGAVGGVAAHTDSLAFSPWLDYRLPDAVYLAELDSLLRAELGGPFVELLSERSRPLDPDSAYGVVLEAAREIPEPGHPERPLRLLAVDRMAQVVAATWLPGGSELDSLASFRREELDALGVRFAYNPLGGVWVYTGDLVRELRESAPDGRWGHHALLVLQLRAWTHPPGCLSGAETFRPVIERGEAFLVDHASSSIRTYVALTVAQAWETLWSVSRMAPDDAYRDYVDPEPLRDEAEEARRRGAELYRVVAQEAGHASLRAYAEAKARALEADLDTGQRKFLCVYD